MAYMRKKLFLKKWIYEGKKKIEKLLWKFKEFLKSNWSRKAHVLGIKEFSRTRSVIVDSWKNSKLAVKRPVFKPRFCYYLNMKSSASCFYVNMGNPCFSLDSEELKPVNPKGNQPWILIGRTEAEAPILWPLDTKGQLIGKDSDAGEDWG